MWAAGLALAAFSRRRGRPTASGFAAASVGLVIAAGVASGLGHGRSGGRDAVRLVGSPAALLPGLRIEAEAVGVWSAAVLDWGPLYEPHRHPGGAPLGERLGLPRGSYELRVEIDPGLPLPETLPGLAVVEEKRLVPQHPRLVPFRSGRGGLVAGFDAEGEGAVSLRLDGGGPLSLRLVTLRRSTFSPSGGLTLASPEGPR